MTWRQRIWLCLPPVLAWACDVAATLLGQGPRYWSGDYASAQELNPIAGPLLAYHPAAFVGGVTLWAALIVVLLFVWRGPLALVLAFAVTVGHSIGAAAWMATQLGLLGYAAAVVWLFAASLFADVSHKRAGLGV